LDIVEKAGMKIAAFSLLDNFLFLGIYGIMMISKRKEDGFI